MGVDSTQATPASLRSLADLARRMAAIARDMRAAVADALADAGPDDPLARLHADLRRTANAAPDLLQFADMYAQTTCYGLFAARCGQAVGVEGFTHEEALELAGAPPLLRRLLGVIADPNSPLARPVAELVDLLNHPDLAAVLTELGGEVREDPTLHFYEHFLAAYDPGLRALRGVYYTPDPIVHALVRAVDVALRTALALPDGLADPTVTVLDPAAGTGTFLSAVIRHVHALRQDVWPEYAANHLLPRLVGFELLAAPHAAARLKLGLQLRATGLIAGSSDRLRLYQKNALEGPFEAATPTLVVLGNPPYANFGGADRGPWIRGLLADYKQGLGERKLNLDDAFIKFIRFGQWQIERAGAGVLAFVVSNTFLSGLTHRRMRESLLASFSELLVLDLHGGTRQPARAAGAERDENVFDIQQGVAIIVMSRARGERSGPCRLAHAELRGSRESKYRALAAAELPGPWRPLRPAAPHFFFVPKDLDRSVEYHAYPSLHADVFHRKNTGVQTKRDRLVYHFEPHELAAVLGDITDLPPAEFSAKYDLPADGRDWTLAGATVDVRAGAGAVERVLYHPFDLRWTWYSGRSRGFMAYPRSPLLRSALRPNLLLLTVRNARRGNVDSFFVASTLVDKDAVSPLDNATFFPLYVYNEAGERALNLCPEFTRSLPRSADPEQVFYYIYAVLHAPSYRSRYADLLRIDYPRIPPTSDAELFAALADKGQRLVDLHLLRGDLRPTCGFVGAGDHPVERPRFADDQVFVNRTHFFTGVPAAVWGLHIGGAPVLARWLKERRGRVLSLADVQRFQQIAAALSRTLAIMREIDEILDAHGGWPLARADRRQAV